MAKVKVYAKVNISLFITEKKEEYHALSSVVVSSSLCDEIVVNIAKKDSVTFSTQSHYDEQRVYFTINAMRKDYDFAPIEIFVQRNIPLSAGLGGSSASVAGTIRAINDLFELNLSREKMIEYANLTGSDNAFMLFGGAGMIEDRSTPTSSFEIKDIDAVIVVKGECPTKDVFSAFAKNPTYCDGKINKEIIKLLVDGEFSRAVKLSQNSLTNCACEINKDIAFALNELDCSFMTGSGSGVVALNPKKSALEKLEEVGFRIYKCKLGAFKTESIK